MKRIERRYQILKSDRAKAISFVQSEIRGFMGDLLRKEGFVEIAPVIISPLTDPLHHATHRGEIEYYGHKYHLMRSMIFHKQLTLLAHDKIFIFSPNLRFEPIELADTGRHLIEFTQLDLEVREGTRDVVMDLGERLVVGTIERIRNTCEAELKILNREITPPPSPFERVPYRSGFERFGKSFETALSYQKLEPFWIIDIPIEAREFYDREDPDHPGALLDMDLIYPEGYGEAISGGEREYEPEKVRARIEKDEYAREGMDWYLKMVDLGIPRSAGFGIGIERFTRYICGLRSIEEASLFPKLPGDWSL